MKTKEYIVECMLAFIFFELSYEILSFADNIQSFTVGITGILIGIIILLKLPKIKTKKDVTKI